ncbi:hypothetical protein [Hymenobacter norwichensis]|uniref:hypothetical protein n=1 Tax=Hymenobacter norwichensis TaxID=223903 RepID=UPI0003B429D0|nr:hypothetical protein [Hymenobacter norwichensis]
MADINIQRKKSSPSPWLLILLVVLALGALAWYLLREDASQPVSSGAETPIEQAPINADSGAAPRPDDQNAVGDMATAEPLPTPEALAGATQRDPASPNYARNGLRILSAVLVDLADRADLRDPAVNEKRDVLTSATARLDDSTASLRPGFVAATGLMQAMQQKAYPTLEPTVADLITRAGQLSGRSTTPDDQQQLRDFFTRATEVVRALNEPGT